VAVVRLLVQALVTVLVLGGSISFYFLVSRPCAEVIKGSKLDPSATAHAVRFRWLAVDDEELSIL